MSSRLRPRKLARLAGLPVFVAALGAAVGSLRAEPEPAREVDLGETRSDLDRISWPAPSIPTSSERSFEDALAHSRARELSEERMAALLAGEQRLRDAEKHQGQEKIDLLEAAARDGDPASMQRLGDMLANGDELAPDRIRAFAYHRAAALGGSMEAAHDTGAAYAAAAGVGRDFAEALAWLIVARERGDPSDAEARLRQHLLDRKWPDAIATAETRARVLAAKRPAAEVTAALPPPGPLRYRPAADAGAAETVDVSELAPDRAARRAPSADEVVVMTITGERLAWPTLTELERAADRGDVAALDGLGRLLAAGRHVPPDHLRAVVLLERSAALGNVDAAHKLGDLYSEDDVIQRDDAKAFTYYLQAARGGSILAMATVGVDYTNGRGVARDYVHGLAWLIAAKHFGVDRGQEGRLRSFLQTNHPEQVAQAEKEAEELTRALASPKA